MIPHLRVDPPGQLHVIFIIIRIKVRGNIRGFASGEPSADQIKYFVCGASESLSEWLNLKAGI